MHSDKQKLFLTTFKKWVLAKKSGQIPHSELEFQVAVQLSVFVLVALSPSKARRVGLGLCVRAKSSRLDTQTHKRMVGSWKRRQTMDDDAWKCPIKITYTQRVPEAAALCHEACGNWQKIKAHGNKVNPLTPHLLQNSSQKNLNYPKSS